MRPPPQPDYRYSLAEHSRGKLYGARDQIPSPAGCTKVDLNLSSDCDCLCRGGRVRHFRATIQVDVGHASMLKVAIMCNGCHLACGTGTSRKPSKSAIQTSLLP